MFDPDVSLAAGGDPNIVYYHSHWALADDQALVIEAMPPECEHWNFQLNNYWMESLDYRYPPSTGTALATTRADVPIRLVVAAPDPGSPTGWTPPVHSPGTMCFPLDLGQRPSPKPAAR